MSLLNKSCFIFKGSNVMFHMSSKHQNLHEILVNFDEKQ